MKCRFSHGFLAVLAGLFIYLSLPSPEARAVPSQASPSHILAAIPPRPSNAITGSEFAKRTSGMPEAERQAAALNELRRGNVPNFMRNLRPVTLSGKNKVTATIWVMPDYLSIGSDEDFLRIPLTLPSALAIAADFGCTLPTPRIVDAIYQQARVKVAPRPLPAGPAMRSNDYYLKHQHIVQEQLSAYKPGNLTAGHKKDVVMSTRLSKFPGRIAIYGWHKTDGSPIQPLSTVHGENYADYSHGIRLISAQVEVNSSRMPMTAPMRSSPVLSLLTDEGVIPDLPG